jgi:hypothetical protein
MYGKIAKENYKQMQKKFLNQSVHACLAMRILFPRTFSLVASICALGGRLPNYISY